MVWGPLPGNCGEQLIFSRKSSPNLLASPPLSTNNPYILKHSKLEFSTQLQR